MFFISSLFLWKIFSCLKNKFNIRVLLQENPTAVMVHVAVYGPMLAECLKDGSTPVKLAAERCALHALQLTKGINFFFLVDVAKWVRQVGDCLRGQIVSWTSGWNVLIFKTNHRMCELFNNECFYIYLLL